MRLTRCCIVVIIFATAVCANAQSLRFSNHSEVEVPEYATLRLGPFYSTLWYQQKVGYRYTESNGAATDFLFRTRRGKILEDGSEIPISSSLTSQNYLIISRYTSLDVSFSVGYEHYPLGTQEDDTTFNLADEGVFGDIRMGIVPSEYFRAAAYSTPIWITDYVDARGSTDTYTGERYERFEHTLGVDMDWLVAKGKNVGATVMRQDVRPRDSGFDDQDQTSHSFLLLFEQEVAPWGIIGTRASFRETEYNDSDRNTTDIQEYLVYSRLGLRNDYGLEAALGHSRGDIDGEVSGGEGASESTTASLAVEGPLAKAMSHSLRYSKSLVEGFASSFEIRDTAGYFLDWQGDLASHSLSVRYYDVEIVDGPFGDYSEHQLAYQTRYMIRPELALRGGVSYSARRNDQGASTEGVPFDVVGDYETLEASVGTGYAVTKKTSLDSRLSYADRTSDDEELEFDRVTGEITLTYRHQF